MDVPTRNLSNALSDQSGSRTRSKSKDKPQQPTSEDVLSPKTPHLSSFQMDVDLDKTMKMRMLTPQVSKDVVQQFN